MLSNFVNIPSHLPSIGFAPGTLATEFKRLNPSNITMDDVKDCIYSKYQAAKSVSAQEQYVSPPAL